jgi:hypothetical protein
MSASPFATLNGELPPAARVAIDAARAVAEAAQSAYEQNRAETASVRAEIVAISAAVATAETTARSKTCGATLLMSPLWIGSAAAITTTAATANIPGG